MRCVIWCSPIKQQPNFSKYFLGLSFLLWMKHCTRSLFLFLSLSLHVCVKKRKRSWSCIEPVACEGTVGDVTSWRLSTLAGSPGNVIVCDGGCVWEQIGGRHCMLVRLCLLCSEFSLLFLLSDWRTGFLSLLSKFLQWYQDPVGMQSSLKGRSFTFWGCNIASLLYPIIQLFISFQKLLWIIPWLQWN